MDFFTNHIPIQKMVKVVKYDSSIVRVRCGGTKTCFKTCVPQVLESVSGVRTLKKVYDVNIIHYHTCGIKTEFLVDQLSYTGETFYLSKIFTFFA